MARIARSKTTQAKALPEGYTYQQLLPLVGGMLHSGISVLLRGHPGVGKSSLARELSQAMNLPLIDIRLAQRDPAEIGGVHFPDRERKVLDLFPPQWVRNACSEPSFVFLDEINAAVTKLHQAVAYQIVLEHRIGEFAFHPGTVVMAAGNLEEDNAIVTALSSALCNRFAHFILRVDARTWLDWGIRAGVDPSIMAYIGQEGEEALYDNSGDVAFPSPRTWEMASRVLPSIHESDQKRAVAACVGVAAAERYFSFRRIYGEINAAKIIGQGAPVNFTKGKYADPSFIYAAVFAVASHVTRGNPPTDAQLPNVVTFLTSPGLDPEYVMLFLKQVKSRSSLVDRLKPLPAFQDLARRLVDLKLENYR